MLGRQLNLSWLFCDRFRIFTGGCKQFCTGELVFRYLEFVFHGNLFSLVLHLNVAFAVIGFERIAPTACSWRWYGH